MIEFLLVVYLGSNIVDQTQRFADIDRCRYFAERLTHQPAVPTTDNRNIKMVAICKPVPK